ncbi:hypothetical protein MPH_09340 [Macrophomina phaseolina MS6]|uniref:Uncharacterized protein n=1 Tax=Macrophomina phaseolina (strain MS6) TaxID=1126212 RepID=K2RG02_MACPH|nr:hypothetical protein MPH_09340 [Macrophomina phaseolina MS6]
MKWNSSKQLSFSLAESFLGSSSGLFESTPAPSDWRVPAADDERWAKRQVGKYQKKENDKQEHDEEMRKSQKNNTRQESEMTGRPIKVGRFFMCRKARAGRCTSRPRIATSTAFSQER